MRFDLTEEEWRIIEPLLPPTRQGGERRDDRQVLDGIFYVLRTGIPWDDLPARYGPHTTAYNRFNRWARQASVRRVGATAAVKPGDDRQHGNQSPSRGGRGRKRGLSPEARAHAEAIGRSRGGRTTKLHAVVDEAGRLTRFCLTGGHQHDMAGVDPLLLQHDATAATVIADKAYDAARLRSALAKRGAEVVIPFRVTARMPQPIDRALYGKRNLIERAFNRLKDYRRIATRFDKLARNFAAAIALTAIRLWYLIRV